MKVFEYQNIIACDTGTTTYVAEVGKILKIDGTLPYKEAYELIVQKLDIKPTEILQKEILIGKKLFKYETDLLNSNFEQFSRLDILLAENKNVQNLHFLLAIFLRPVNLINKIQKYDLKDQEKIAKYIQENMNIEDAFGLLLFFYHYAALYTNYMSTRFFQALMNPNSTLIKDK